MSIALSEDQVALAESVTKFAARHAPTATTRRELDNLAAGIRPSWGDALRKQGLLSLHLPARAGGDEAGLEELAVVVEETGRGLLPGPFLPTVLASSVVARLAASPAHDDLLARFGAGATGTCATTAAGLTAERATDASGGGRGGGGGGQRDHGARDRRALGPGGGARRAGRRRHRVVHRGRRPARAARARPARRGRPHAGHRRVPPRRAAGQRRSGARRRRGRRPLYRRAAVRRRGGRARPVVPGDRPGLREGP